MNNSFIEESDQQSIAKELANQIKLAQTEGSGLYEIAQQIIKFYQSTFKRTQDSYRQLKNARYYNVRFSANKSLGNSYLSLNRGKISQKYIKDLHSLQHLIENFMSKFLNRPITQYAIYYTDKEGNTYRKELTSQEEQKMYSQSSMQSMRLTKQTKNMIMFEIKDAEIQTKFSEHFNNYRIQIEKIYEKMSQSTQYNAIFKRQKFNEGIKAEAFERHFQKIHHGNQEHVARSTEGFQEKELMENLLASFGFTPWWSKGDVGTFQIKSFTDKSQSVSIGSVRSLEELLNFIYLISNKNLYSQADCDRIAKTVVVGLMDQGFNTSLENTLKGLLKNLNNNS